MTTTSRRNFLLTSLGAGLGAATLLPAGASAAAPAPVAPPQAPAFRYCLNTSTLMGQKLGVVKEIEIAAQAGYQAIEIWVRSLDEYATKGGSLADLRKRIADLGLTVEAGIAFASWIVDDPAARAKALEQAKREMDLLAKIGAKRIAAPASGAKDGTPIPLDEIAKRYRALLEVGDQTGVVPELELWGHSVNLHNLAQCAYIVIASDHPKACLLPDVYHLYKGGSSFDGLRMFSSQAIQVCHLNDYPATPARDAIADRDRIYPGDGTAPYKQILTDLCRINPQMVLSLELFNQTYWKQDPLVVAKTGLEKMKQVVSLVK